MTLRWAFPFLLLFAFSCKPDQVNQQYALTDEQLVYLLLDMQLSEITLPELTKERQDTLSSLYKARMEDLYSLPLEKLEDEIRKLESDPEKMKIIIQKVQTLVDSLR